MMEKTKKLVLSALFVAMGVLLPIAFHAVPNAGRVFLPMHLSVLLCGLLCGPVFGTLCGAMTPLISSLTTGMPPTALLPGMTVELAVYGLVTGLLRAHVRTGRKPADLYIALVAAMLAGRVVKGILDALLFSAGTFTLKAWLAASFATALPGILVQLAVVPVLVMAVEKATFLRKQP